MMRGLVWRAVHAWRAAARRRARARVLRRLIAGGVRVGPGARLCAARGIQIGPGTEIHDGATLAACHLEAWAGVDDESAGEIVIGARCAIMPGAILASCGGRIEIGDDVSINPYCVLYGHGGLTIGAGARIAAHTVIIPANHVFSDPDRPLRDQGYTARGVRIGADVWIGAGARILDGVTVGDRAVIGAGSVVTRDVAPGQVVGGVPARPLHQRGDAPPFEG
jgi:acetyltransferase-like isoleucine patch superfamily enzyme